MFFDPETRELLRTRPSPLTWDQARAMRGARPAGPPPRPSTEPVTAQRRASNTGVIMVAGQKIALGRIHAGQTVTVHAADQTVTIDLDDKDSRTVRRTADKFPSEPILPVSLCMRVSMFRICCVGIDHPSVCTQKRLHCR